MKWISKPLLGTQLNWAHPLNKGLVGYWLFNEGMGNKVNDLSMNGNVGTLMGMAFPSTPASGWNPGKKGVGLNFDGVNDYVDCGNNASLNITTTITISAWINHNVAIDITSTILAKDGVLDNTRAFQMVKYLNGKIRFILWDSVGGAHALYSDNNSLSNIWYHVVGTYDGVTQKLYVNSILQSTSNTMTGIKSVITTHVIIGMFSTNYAKGAIDDVRIYNRALSANEVMELYIDPYGSFL